MAFSYLGWSFAAALLLAACTPSAEDTFVDPNESADSKADSAADLKRAIFAGQLLDRVAVTGKLIERKSPVHRYTFNYDWNNVTGKSIEAWLQVTYLDAR